MDYGWCHARLATGGGIATVADVERLVQDGVRAIIDCRAEADDAPLLAGHPMLAYIWLPVEDDGRPKAVSWFGKGIAFALAQLTQPRCKVLSHCAAGSNRGPSMALSILLAQGIGYDEALAMVLKARPGAGVRYRSDAKGAVESLGYV